ncbi:MAG: glycosyltransferase, partial [Amphiplicatus sp.]
MTREIFHVFATFAIGGPQMRFATLANAFGKRYRHSILSMDGNYAAADRLSGDVEYRLRADIAPEKRRTLKNVFAFRRLLADERPDLLVTSNWGSMEWAMANRPSLVPHLHMEDGFGPEEASKQLARRTWFRRLALGGKHIVVASKTLETIAHEKWSIPPQRLHFIANGVDAARFDRAPDPALVEKLGDPADGPLIGTLAGLRAEKNLPRLVEAFAAINAKIPARLAIIGEGPERGAVETRAHSLGVGERIFLPGYIADPASILGAFDLFMMSSDTEQAPVSLLEAMAAGLAVA